MDAVVVQVNSQSFESDVLKNELPVVVYFYSEDCPPCVAFTPIFDRMAEQLAGRIKFVKVFRQHNRQLAEIYSIKSSPTLLFFKKGQEVCSRLNGYISKPELRESVESVLGGSCVRKERQKVNCDVLIMGAGPAGLSAAIYASRAKLFTVVIDEGIPGGQVSTTYHVANYPGTNGVVRGMDLMENMKKQAMDFGAQIDDLKETLEVSLEGDIKHIKSDDTDYYAKTVIIATGAQPKKLPAEGEREFRGRGVHYCATCDGAMYQDANVLVIGGGNSALDEAVFLTRYAKHVTIVNRNDSFSAQKVSQNEVLNNPNISIMWNTEVTGIEGENFVKSVVLLNNIANESSKLETDGLFVYIGSQPKTEIFEKKLLDEQGYIVTDEDMNTRIPGVFAAGDVRVKKVRQIATAVGDGTIAGIMAERYINNK